MLGQFAFLLQQVQRVLSLLHHGSRRETIHTRP
jgi:hypothetical protein